MRGPRGSLGHPATQEGDFGWLQLTTRRARGHDFFVISAARSEDQFTFGRVARGHHRYRFLGAEKTILSIEPQFGFAPAFIRTVAMITRIGENRQDVLAKINRSRRPRFSGASDVSEG